MKNKTKWLLGASLLSLLLAWGAAEAGSTFRKAGARARSLIADPTARKVGDSLTIIINERSVVETETERKLDKSSSESAKMGGTLDLANMFWSVGKHIFDFPKLDFSSSTSRKFEGAGELEDDWSIIDKITVTVQDVQPNGNLVVSGTIKRTVRHDVQTIQVSGIIRPDDIAYENTVSSTRVAQFRLVNRVEGQENSFTSPGWMATFGNILNPF